MAHATPQQRPPLATTKKVAIVMAVLGGLAPLVARATSDLPIGAFILVDMAINAAVWFGIIMLVGWVISKLRRKPAHVAVGTDTGSPPDSTATRHATAGADLPPPGWHPDPYGRFEFRYWDGRWTSQTSSHGRIYEDPTG